MTMADTIAVMNQGVIEQMGAPTDLYENPRTTFVSNFLGQSNLVMGAITGADATDIRVFVNGDDLVAPAARATETAGEVWVGVRPEKVRLTLDGDHPGPGENVLRGGIVTDVSFIGVSTQYLVRMPWEQELTVFEQNSGVRSGFRPGDKVNLQWRAEHTFLLDAQQDATAGSELEDEPA